MKDRRGDGFEQLKAYWYRKLKASGFEDAETPHGVLKDWPAHRIKRDYTPEKFVDKQEYYRLAGQFLFEHSFPNEHERKVWELHAHGLSARDIAFELRDETNHVNKDNIQKITSKYGKLIRARIMHAQD